MPIRQVITPNVRGSSQNFEHERPRNNVSFDACLPPKPIRPVPTDRLVRESPVGWLKRPLKNFSGFFAQGVLDKRGEECPINRS
jgi:hypothetical protein